MQIHEFKLSGEKFSLDLIFFDNFCPMSDGPFQNIHVLTMFRYVPAALGPWVLSYSKFREKFQSLKIFSAAQISFFNNISTR